MEVLTEKQKELVREFVQRKCEECGKSEKETGTLEIHRIKRGNMGGLYTLRNIKVLCSKCHKLFHYNEPGTK